MGSKILKNILLLCCCLVAVNGTTHTDWEYKSWIDEVKQYTTEPDFSNMPDKILESYRFAVAEGWGGGYLKYIRISKIHKKDSLFYVIDSANIGYSSNKKRIHARITKKEWEGLRNSINSMLSYQLVSRDKRHVLDAGLLLIEGYKDKKKFYIWRYNIDTKEDSDALRLFYRTFSDINRFNTESIVNNKSRNKQVYDLQKELDEKNKLEEEKRKKKYALEQKRQKALFDKQRLWKTANTGAVVSIGYFKNMNANIVNSKGQTPLMVAVKNGHIEVVRALSDAIVDVWKKDNRGKTAFDYIEVLNANTLQYKRMYSALRVVEVSQIVSKKAKITQYDYHHDTDMLNVTISGAECDVFIFPKHTQCRAEKLPSKNEIFKAIKTKNNTYFDILLPTIKDLSIRNKSKYTPLWASIHYENYYALERLLVAGADMYELDQNGLKTPVYWVTMINNTKLLKILLKHGADVNSKDVFGSLALSTWAFKCNNFEAIKILLDNGANPYLKDKRGKTVFDKEPSFCKDKQNIAKMKKLLHSMDAKGLKVQAIKLNVIEKIAYEEEEILRKNKKFDTYLSTLSDVNIVDSAGFTPLHKAVATKDYYAIKKLIDKGADINMLDGKYGVWTPFNYTIAMHDIKALKIFLDNGADVNFYHKGKSTVLNDAIRSCNLDMVKLLLDNGANPRLKDGHGGTVENSLDKCDEEVKKKVLALVQNIITGRTNNMLQVVDKVEFQNTSENRKNKEKIEEIKAYVKEKKNAKNPIFVAIRYKNNIDFDKFLKTVKDIDLKNEQGDTLLYAAVEARNYYAIKKLIAHGANMNYTKEYRTYTPFSYAVGLSDTRAVKLFVDKGVNVNYQYKKSLTNISLAVKQCNIDIIKLLLGSGADIALEDKRGDNAIKSLGFCNKKDNKAIKKLIMGD